MPTVEMPSQSGVGDKNVDVYISCATVDAEWGRSLETELLRRGLRAIVPELDREVSQSLDVLGETLNRGAALVVLWSTAAAQSVWVRRDIDRFTEFGSRTIIPVILGDPDLMTLPPAIRELQFVQVGAETYTAGPDARSDEWRRATDLVANALTTLGIDATTDPPSFSDGAVRALNFAARMLDGASDPGRLRTAALLGALLESASNGMTPTTGDVVRLVMERQEGRRNPEEVIAAAARAAELRPLTNTSEVVIPVESLLSSKVTSLAQDAIAVQRRTASDRVHLRHVLATGVNPSVAPEALAELGVTLSEVRAVWRQSLAQTWTAETWDEILREPDPDRPLIATPPSARVHGDRWTIEDRLDYALYARAIAEFIRHPDAKPPMVISVQGPWGQGKTSLMRMVQRNLDPGHPDLHDVDRHTPSDDACAPPSELTFKELRGAIDGKITVLDTKPVTIRTVWFNAWKYQSSEQIWAGLGHAILAQLPARLTRRQRELFWVRLQWRRIDPGAVREDIHKAILEKFVPMLAGWVVLIFGLAVAGGVALALGGFKAIALAWAGTGIFATAIAVRSAWAKATKQALGRHLEGAYLRYVQQPDYTGKLGYLHLVEEDMKRALELLTPDNQPAVIFIDDLDRCSPAKIGEVIEAVNLFLAGDYPNCAFVIGIDAEVVAASMEVLHADIIDKLGDRRGELGWRFMDKFVQLPFVMPRLHPNQREAYLRGLFGVRKKEEARAIEADADRLQSQVEQRQLPVDELARRVGELAPRLAAVDPDRARVLGEDVIAAGASEFSDSDPEVIQALANQLGYLSDNPRTIKRAANLYRFHRFAAFARQASALPLDVATPEQIGRWIVVIIRWPQFVRWLQAQSQDGLSSGRDPARRVLDLAAKANTSEAFGKALGEDGIDASWSADRELWEFLRAEVQPELSLDLAGSRGLW
jgi:hypothetical protein